MKLSAVMEDYLETIYSLRQENGFARVKEIAERLNVKSPTVNSAIAVLADQGLVIHEKYGYVGLTRKGTKAALEVKNKHEILFRFLAEFLLLDPHVAEKEACCIEHSISQETFLRLTKFFKFLEEGFDKDRPKIFTNFEEYLKTGKRPPCSCGR